MTCTGRQTAEQIAAAARKASDVILLSRSHLHRRRLAATVTMHQQQQSLSRRKSLSRHKEATMMRTMKTVMKSMGVPVPSRHCGGGGGLRASQVFAGEGTF